MTARRKTVIFGFDMESDVGSYTTEHRGVREATPAMLDIFKTPGETPGDSTGVV